MGTRHAVFFKGLCAAVALFVGTVASTPSQAEIKGLEIIAPASPGGGWDQHARALQQVMQNQGVASGIQVMNIPGAGGTVGLAQFVTAKKRNPTLLVGGQIMLGAIVTNKSAVTLDQVTPLARLTGEYTGIVVPADSPIKSMDDLVKKFKADPGSVSWGGGSAGGSDQILAGLIAKSVGVDPTKVNYVATAGGGELMASALGGHITAALGGFSEFTAQVQAGKLRAIAVSSPQRMAGDATPTLKEQGINLEFSNWRAVFAHANLKPAERKELEDAVAKAVSSDEWKQLSGQRGWVNTYLPSEQFAAFLKEERVRIEGTLKDLGIAK